MDRLTKRFTDGGAYCEEIIDVGIKGVNYPTYVGKAVDKLAEYEDLEEQGKLLKLPCAVGDRIYRIDTDEKLESRDIEICDINNIVILSDETILLKYDAYDGVICEIENIVTDKPYLDFYRCFLTKSAAEQSLKEVEANDE